MRRKVRLMPSYSDLRSVRNACIPSLVVTRNAFSKSFSSGDRIETETRTHRTLIRRIVAVFQTVYATFSPIDKYARVNGRYAIQFPFVRLSSEEMI